MTDPFTWRRATLDDVPALHTLVNSAYRGEFSRRGWTTEAEILEGQRTDPEALRELIAASDGVILVGERAEGAAGEAGATGRVIACVNLQRKSDRAYLGMLTVWPELQAAGVGRRMLELAERFVRETWGLGRIQMTVIRQRDTLIAWYERRGYRRTGERERFHYGDPRFGVPKRDDLEFVYLEKTLEA